MFKGVNLQLFAENEDKQENETNQNETNNENGTNQNETNNETNNEKENDVSRETLIKTIEKHYSIIGKSLSGINNNIKKIGSIEPDEEDNSINLSSEDNKKILVDKNNKKLSDYEVFRRSLVLIEADKKSGKKIPISPDFIKYMEKYVENCDKNIVSTQQFRSENIFEKIPLDEAVIE